MAKQPNRAMILNVIHLENEASWRRRFEQFMPFMREAFSEFWHDTFSSHFGSKCPVKLKLLPAQKGLDLLKKCKAPTQANGMDARQQSFVEKSWRCG